MPNDFGIAYGAEEKDGELDRFRQFQTAALVSTNHPRLAQVINELAAFADLSVEVVDDEAFEVYVHDLGGQKFYLREFVQNPEATAKDPARVARVVPRYIPGDVYGGYEFVLLHANSSGSDEPLMDGVFVVRKGVEETSGPEGLYRALRLDPPTGRSLAETLLTFLEEDAEERERQVEQSRKYFAKQAAEFRAKLPPVMQECGCSETCPVHKERDCSSCEYAGGHAYACPTRQAECAIQ